MFVVAILGAGPIGAATAHSLARRAGGGAILLVDAAGDAAVGKALDIQQAGPVEAFDTRLSASSDTLAAAGATVIVMADRIDEGEWLGDDALALVRQLIRAGVRAPLVFAGASQTALMEACVRELRLPAHRAIGTAPSALVGAVQALAGLELNLASAEVTVVGRPPEFVIGWSAATIHGSLVTERAPAHRLLAISQSLPRLWPPGPHAIGAATARAVEALIFGSRKLLPALTVVGDELGVRDAAVMLPLELGRLRVLAHVMPSLSSQERTALVNSLSHKR
jgi:malate dehydrogenase